MNEETQTEEEGNDAEHGEGTPQDVPPAQVDEPAPEGGEEEEE